jgi:hypothetical protein
LRKVGEHLDLRTGRFHPPQLLIMARAAPQAPYRERFSPVAHRRRQAMSTFLSLSDIANFMSTRRGIVMARLGPAILYRLRALQDCRYHNSSILFAEKRMHLPTCRPGQGGCRRCHRLPTARSWLGWT